MEGQISIYELLECSSNQEEESETDYAPHEGERIITIPDDIWGNRCRICVHKVGTKNFPVPVHMMIPRYDNIMPCRIISLFHERIQGECVNFVPDYSVRGICLTCEYNNIFCEGYCTKKDHAKQRRVYYGNDPGGPNSDYWSRHVLSTCDDYKDKISIL